MKKIIYYITDHGRGHATRTVAIIRELQKYDLEIVIRNSNAVDFLKKSLPEIRIHEGLTDVGPILNSDGISLDHKKSVLKISEWINNIQNFSKIESDFLKIENPDLVISDISPMPLIAAKKVEIPSIVISNFSWYDVLTFLPEKMKNLLKNFYDLAELAIKLPLGTNMNHFKKKINVNLVTRNPTKSFAEIKNQFNIKKQKCVLFALGGSDNKIHFKSENDIQIISLNTNIDNRIEHKDLTEIIEGQNLVAISDLVICKCGYGLISECISNEIPFYYLADDSHPEQIAISKELLNMGIDSRISFEQISQLNISIEFLEKLSKPPHHIVDFSDTINYILKFIKK